MAEQEDKLYTILQAAQRAGVPVTTLRQAVKRKRIAVVRISPRVTLIRESALNQWMNDPELHKRGPKKKN